MAQDKANVDVPLMSHAEQLRALEAKFAGKYTVLDVNQIKINADKFEAVKNKVGEKFLREHKVLPLFEADGKLYVAMVDPTDIWVIDNISQQTGMNVESVVALPADLEQVLNSLLVSEIIPDLPDLDNEDLSQIPQSPYDLDSLAPKRDVLGTPPAKGRRVKH